MKHGTLRLVALSLLLLAAVTRPLLAMEAPVASLSGHTVIVAGERQQAALDDALRLVEDPGERVDTEGVLDNPDLLPWKPASTATLHVGPSRSRWWLRVDLHNTDDLPRERVVVIHHPTLDDARFALLCDGGYSDAALSGDALPFSARPLPDRQPAFAFVMPAHERCTLLMAIMSADTVHFPLSLFDRTGYGVQQQRDYLLRGLGLGMQALVVVLGLLAALATRRIRAAHFSLVVAAQAMLVVVLTDLGYEFIWGELPRLQKILAPLAIGIAWWLTADFSLRLLPAGTLPPSGRTALQASWLATLLLALLQVVLPDTLHLSLLVVVVALGMLLLLAMTLGTILVAGARAGMVAAAITAVAVATLIEAGGLLGLGMPQLPYLVALHAGLLCWSLLIAAGLPDQRPERRKQPAADNEINRRVAERTRELASTVAQLRSTNRELDQLAVTDSLTGTFNRRFMDNTLARRAADAVQGPLSFILFDIDHFKQVNDRHGHQAGDRVLRAVADCVQQQLRDEQDILCRYGGEEFAVILPDTDLEGAMAVAEKIRTAVAAVEIPVATGSALRVTVSLGVSTLRGGADPAVLVGSADRALYNAKRTGRNRWHAAG